MAFLESGNFCSSTEYESGFLRRINESQLQVDELYLVMMALDSKKRQAGKHPARLQEVRPGTGLAVIKFTYLDSDLQPQLDTTQTMRDGLIRTVSGVWYRDLKTNESFPVARAYFKDYYDDEFGEYLTQSDSLALADGSVAA